MWVMIGRRIELRASRLQVRRLVYRDFINLKIKEQPE